MDKLFSMTSSSFLDLLKAHAPDLLPGRRGVAPAGLRIPHGTTIVAATYADGVLLAGDRRTTQGNLIAGRDVDKLSITDDHSAVGFAGTVGISLELAKLIEMEILHYEKIEGVPLSLAGKVNRLAAMIKGNLEMATAGMVSLPLFVGYDLDVAAGRIFSYDPIGACYEERDGYQSIGSGSPYARSSLKKRYDVAASETAALTALVEALYDAAEEDTATGGPDMVRHIYPTAIRITEDGATRLAEEEIAAVAATIDPQWTPPSSSGSS